MADLLTQILPSLPLLRQEPQPRKRQPPLPLLLLLIPSHMDARPRWRKVSRRDSRCEVVLTYPSEEVLVAQSAAAAASLPVAPTPIDLRIADALCQGQFDIPPATAHPAPLWHSEPPQLTEQPTWGDSPNDPLPTPQSLRWVLTDASGSDRWYCVSQGRGPGVYSSW